jgi:hypothetical protein
MIGTKNKQIKKINNKKKILSCFRFVGADCRDVLECRYHMIERKRVRIWQSANVLDRTALERLRMRSSVGPGLLCASDVRLRTLASCRAQACRQCSTT